MRVWKIIWILIFSLLSVAGAATDDEIWQSITASRQEFKDSGALIIWDKLNTKYKENGSAVSEEEMLIHFREDDAATEFRAINFDYNPRTANIRFLEVKVFRADGSSIDVVSPDQIFTEKAPADSIFWNFDILICPLPRMAKGDALFYRVERRGLNLAYLDEPQNTNRIDHDFIPPHPGYFMDTVYFEAPHPMLLKEYIIQGPNSRPLQFAMENGAMDASLHFQGDTWEYRFAVENMPAFEDEPFDPGLTQSGLTLALASHTSWEMKSKWAYEHNEPQFVIDPKIQQKVDQIIDGAKDDDDKMFRLLHWVAEEIRYLGLDMGEGEGHMVHRTDEIFRDRAGVCKDKAAILVSMLRAAGFETYFVMTLAMEQTLDIPADDKFNHGVVAVRGKNGDWTFLDPTWAPQNRPLFNHSEQEQPVLIASPEGTGLKHVPYSPPEENPFVIHAESTVNLDGSIDTEMIIETDGNPDGRFRSYLNWMTEKDRDRWIWGLLEDLGETAELVDFSFTNPLDFYQPLKMRIVAHFPDAIEKIDEKLYITPILTRHFWSGRYESDYLHVSGGSEERTHNLALSCTRLVSFHERMTIPSGYEIQKIPDSVKMESGTMDLNFSAKKGRRNEYNIDQTIRIKRRITPVDEISDFTKVADKANELRETMLIFKSTVKKHKNPSVFKAAHKAFSGARSLPATGAVVKNRELSLVLDETGHLGETFSVAAQVNDEDGRDRFADNAYFLNTETQTFKVISSYTQTKDEIRIDSPPEAINKTLNEEVVHAADYRNLQSMMVSLVGVDYGSILHHSVNRITKDQPYLEYIFRPMESYPQDKVTFEAVVPPGQTLKYKLMGDVKDPEVIPSSSSENDSRTWIFKDLPALAGERYAGPFYYKIPMIAVSSWPSWESRMKAISEPFFDFDPTSEVLQTEVKRILQESLSSNEKLSALTEFVSSQIVNVEIQPWRFQYKARPVERVLQTGYGHALDRYKCLAALVEAAGGQFDLCFAGPEDRVSKEVPCLNSLPEIFCKMTLKEMTTYFSWEKHAFLPDRLVGWTGVAVNRDSMRWLTFPGLSTENTFCKMKLKIQISTDLNVKGGMELYYSGIYSPWDQASSDTEKWITRKLPRWISKTEISNLTIEAMTRETVHLLCDFEGALNLESFEDGIEFLTLPNCPGGVQSQRFNISGYPKREYPFYVNAPVAETDWVEITYPKEWKILKKPENVTQDESTTKYNRTIEIEDSLIRYTQNFQWPEAVIPADQYHCLVEQWRLLTSSSGKQIVFRTQNP